MTWIWPARAYRALMAALSRYSIALRSTVSVPPLLAASVAAAVRAWLNASILLRSISPDCDQHEIVIVAARGVEGERRGHQVILADR